MKTKQFQNETNPESNGEVILLEDDLVSSKLCLLCLNTINDDEAMLTRRLSSDLVEEFIKWIPLEESESFRVGASWGSLCSICNTKVIDYQTTLEQLYLMRKKFSSLSKDMQLLISNDDSNVVKLSPFELLLSKTRTLIRNTIQAICYNMKNDPDGNEVRQPNTTSTPVFFTSNVFETDFEDVEDQNEFDRSYAAADELLSSTISTSNSDVEFKTSGARQKVKHSKHAIDEIEIDKESYASITKEFQLKEVRIVLECCDDAKKFIQPMDVGHHTLSKSNTSPVIRFVPRKKLKTKRQRITLKDSVPRKRQRLKTGVEQKCQHCSYTTQSFSGLTNHHKREHKGIPCTRPFPCSFEPCTESFRAQLHLEAHENRFHKDVAFFCPRETCKKRPYFTQYHLDLHNLRHETSARKFPCDQCSSSFFSKSQLKQHKRTHETVRPYLCEHCTIGFRRIPDLEDHQAIAHGIKTERGLPICPDCGFQATSRYYLKQHKRLKHTRAGLNFECPEPNCQFKTISAEGIRLHSHTHTTQKDFKCTQCPKVFKRPNSLKVHFETIHEGFRVKCPECPKEFTMRQRFNDHLIIAHRPEACPLICDVCAKSFPVNSYLREHRKRCIARKKDLAQAVNE